MKIRSQTLPTYSFNDGKINLSLTVPDSWDKLTQSQLRYALFLLTRYSEPIVIKTCFLVRVAGLDIIKRTRTGWKCQVRCHDVSGSKGREKVRRRVFYLSTEQVLGFLDQLDFLDGFSGFQPIASISDRLFAVDSIRRISFQDYLFAEKYYQLYLLRRADKFLAQLGYILYRTSGGERDDTVTFAPEELLATFLWYSDFKALAAANFPHFFKSSKEGGAPSEQDISLGIRAQVRALTDGDITKQQAVFETDCWAALTELDEKAREAEEFKQKTKK